MDMTRMCDQDAAGAEAAEFAVLTGAGTLLLCAHHCREHEAVFTALGYPVSKLAASSALSRAPRVLTEAHRAVGDEWL